MNLRSLIAMALIGLSVVGAAHAIKIDVEGEVEKKSSHILKGKVMAIYSKIVPSAQYETTHSVAAVLIESIEKGEGLKVGELIYVRFISGIRGTGKEGPPRIGGPHENIPAEGEMRRMCLTKGADGGFDVYYVGGFTTPQIRIVPEKKP